MNTTPRRHDVTTPRPCCQPWRLGALATLLLTLALAPGLAAQATERVGDLVSQPGNIPRRLIGYGLVIGLEGSGDRSLGSANGGTPTVRSIANALHRMGLDIPAERLRPKNVAAVVVTAEASPYLRAGGRFEVQVSSIGDATSLRGGVLWMTPLLTDVDQPAVATAQGPLLLADEEIRYAGRRGNSARIPEGGVLEVEPASITALTPRLQLKRPSLATAQRLVAAINGALGDSTIAKADDPGSITLNLGSRSADNLMSFLALVDTISVRMAPEAKVIIDGRSGTVVTGGTVRVASATVSHRGLTLRVGGPPPVVPAPSPADSGTRGSGSAAASGLLAVNDGATVQEVAGALHTAGARPQEIAAMFTMLHDVGALSAEVVVR